MKGYFVLSLAAVISSASQADTVTAQNLFNRDKAIDAMTAYVDIVDRNMTAYCNRLKTAIASFNAANAVIGGNVSADFNTAKTNHDNAVATQTTKRTEYQTAFAKYHTDLGTVNAKTALYAVLYDPHNRKSVQSLLDVLTPQLDPAQDAEADAKQKYDDFVLILNAFDFGSTAKTLPDGTPVASAFTHRDSLHKIWQEKKAARMNLEAQITTLTNSLHDQPTAAQLSADISELNARLPGEKSDMEAKLAAKITADANELSTRRKLQYEQRRLNIYGDKTLPDFCADILE